MMSTTTRFWWIRHAVVTEAGGKVYGAQDLNCDCSDTDRLRWLADYLPGDSAYVTSGLKRTTQTADATRAQGYAGQFLGAYPDLNEQCFGAWEGLSYDEIREKYGSSSQKFWLAPAGKRPDSHEHALGESFHDLTIRVARVLETILAHHPARDIAVFAHGGTIRAAMAIAMGLFDGKNPDLLAPIFALRTDNLSLTRIDHTSYTQDGKHDAYWRIVHFNMLKDSR